MTPGFVSDAVLADDRRGSRAMASGRLEGLRMLRATGPGRIVRSLGRPDGAVPTAHWSKAFLPITLSSQSTPAGEQIAVCMENTTWLGFTDTFPEGLALVVEADPTRPTLSLLSVSARDGNWSSESAAEPGWGYLEVDSVARASLASRPGGTDVLIGWITQGGGDGAAAGVVAVAYTADGNLFRPPVQASDPAHLSIQNVCLVFVETPGGTADFGALLAYSARSADTGSVRRVYLRWSEDGGFNWDTRSFVLDDSASATTEQDFPCVVCLRRRRVREIVPDEAFPLARPAWRRQISRGSG